MALFKQRAVALKFEQLFVVRAPRKLRISYLQNSPKGPIH
jgi:hypothetical protein